MIYYQLLGGLSLWSTISCGLAMLGLFLGAREYWKCVWLMTGVWGFAEGLTVVAALLNEPLTVGDLEPLLRLYAGFMGLILAAGAILCTRPSPRWSGFGLAITVQASVLLAINASFWLSLS